jgi:hypothetical protein
MPATILHPDHHPPADHVLRLKTDRARRTLGDHHGFVWGVALTLGEKGGGIASVGGTLKYGTWTSARQSRYSTATRVRAATRPSISGDAGGRVYRLSLRNDVQGTVD